MTTEAVNYSVVGGKYSREPWTIEQQMKTPQHSARIYFQVNLEGKNFGFRVRHFFGRGSMNDVVVKFGQSLRGTLIDRDHPDYDEARKLYNGMIDKRPLLIARCADVADVIAAVNFGRENDFRIAIRGGGHNGPGLGSVDDGLVIDLSMMKGVRVDPDGRTVRVGPGCTSGDVDHATHAFGLAVPFGIVSTTGVSGLTLGGGSGYLTRKYGLTIDNLRSA